MPAPPRTGGQGEINDWGHEVLSTVSFFAEASATEQQSIRELCTPRSVRRKEVVVRQGSIDREMFIVESGRLRISAVSEDGKEVGFGVLEAGDTFGELAMLDAEPRSASVTAIEACALLVLSPAQFEQLVFRHPRLALKLLVILAQRLRHTTRIYQDSVFMDVPARLARFLLEFSHPAKEAGSAPVVDVTLSQYELGTLINASRESVNKQLREWESQGLIESAGGKIRLTDVRQLRLRAAGDD